MTNLRKQVTQHPRQLCYFCGSEGPIETHHIVPRRHDGSDDEENLVDLCPTCHERLEALYNVDFYDSLGIETAKEGDEEKEETDKVNVSRETYRNVKETVEKFEEDSEKGAPINDVLDEVVHENEETPLEEAKAALLALRKKGEVYEPCSDHLRAT